MASYFEIRMAEIRNDPALISMSRAKPRHEKSPLVEPTGSPGWIYFITSEDAAAVKIGFTADRNISRRVNDLQTGTHQRLRVDSFFPAHRAAEKMLHRRFAKDRIRREWFRLTDEIEDLWDDLLDYQGMRCSAKSTGARSGRALLEDMHTNPVDLNDLAFILNTIGHPWPAEFCNRIMAP